MAIRATDGAKKTYFGIYLKDLQILRLKILEIFLRQDNNFTGF